jgi:hypothetical protein
MNQHKKVSSFDFLQGLKWNLIRRERKERDKEKKFIETQLLLRNTHVTKHHEKNSTTLQRPSWMTIFYHAGGVTCVA